MSLFKIFYFQFIFLIFYLQNARADLKPCNSTVIIKANSEELSSGVVFDYIDYAQITHECSVVFQVDSPDYGLYIQFVSVPLRTVPDCNDKVTGKKICCDYVRIGSDTKIGENSLLTACGNETFNPIVIDWSNSIWLTVSSKALPNKNQVRLIIKPVQVVFRALKGTIEPISFQRSYLKNQSMTYRIELPEDRLVRLKIDSISLESGSQGNNECVDYVRLSSKNSTQTNTEQEAFKPLQTICNLDSQVSQFVADSNKLNINFVTSSFRSTNGSGSGFKISYTDVKYLFTEPTGFIESEPHPDLNVTYLIRAPANHVIQLVFEKFQFDQCLSKKIDEQVSTSNVTCSIYNDHLVLTNKGGSLEKEVTKIIDKLTPKWILCACNLPVKTYVSLTNELNVKYIASSEMPLHQTHKNAFRIAYRFLSSIQTEEDTIRIVQDNLTTSFIGGYNLRIKVPENHHLRLYGKSEKCTFPISSRLYQHLNWEIELRERRRELTVNWPEFRRECTFSFEINEPKQRYSDSNYWMVNWYLNFNSSFDQYDFEISWSFIQSRISNLDKKTFSGSVHLPRKHGFEFNELSKDNTQEIELNFLSSNLNRNYKIYFQVKLENEKSSKLEFLRQKYVTFLEKSTNRYELINTEFYTEQNPFELKEINGTSIRIKRDSLYTIDLFYSIDSNLGDCDFDKSLCGYLFNSYPIEINPLTHELIHNTGNFLTRHAPKQDFLNTHSKDLPSKAKDFFLSIQSDLSDSAGKKNVLYSPLIQVQPERKSAGFNIDLFNARVYSVSFKFTTSLNQNSILFFLLQNRSDIQNFTQKSIFKTEINMFNINSMNDEDNKDNYVHIIDNNEHNCETSVNRDQYLSWNPSSDMPVWIHVKKQSFFSCYNFRLGFLMSHSKSSGTDSDNSNTIGIDDIELNVENTLLQACEANVCENNARCFMFEGTPRCCCSPGFEGDRCEISHGICELLNAEHYGKNICHNNGTCVNKEGFDYQCMCKDGYEGKNCEIEKNECASSPCKNAGQCIDLINGFVCACKSGFTGATCQFKNDNCNTQCHTENTLECLEGINGKIVCVCKPNFGGDDCATPVITNRCTPDKNPCAENSKCIVDANLPEGFRCMCPEDRTGRFCETRLNYCRDFPNLCLNGSACIYSNIDASNFVCSCEFGFTGRQCNQTIDNCASNPCVNGVCESFRSGFKCSCYRGNHGAKCDRKPINPCYKNKCVFGICVPDNVKSNYTCSCHHHAEGEYCEINKCSIEKKGCNAEGTLNAISSNSNCYCMCKPGYSGEKCEIRLDPCGMRFIASQENECLNSGSCVFNNETNAVSCVCKPGYTGSRCELIENYCRSSPCIYGQCRNDGHSFKCICIDGWSGIQCDIPKNQCNMTVDCVPGNTVEVLADKQACFCVCKPGFTGPRCQTNIDDCLANDVKCVNNGTCVDLVNNYECKCPLGYTGASCLEKIHSCEQNPCRFGYCDMPNGHLKCVCDKDHTGEFCETFINKCQPNPCENGGICHNLIDDYKCECPAEFGTSRNCTERFVDPCKTSPCLNDGKCTSRREASQDRTKDIYTSYHCECPASFRGKDCELRNDPCSSNPCNNRGYCSLSQTSAGFECICFAAFTGKHCESSFDWCASSNSLCLNGGTCYNTRDGYSCQCAHRFYGKNCGKEFTPCHFITCMNGGKCTMHENIPYCKCPNNRFIGTRCEIDLNTFNFSKHERFNHSLKTSADALHNSEPSCDMLGNDVTPIDYVLVVLVLFFLLVVILVLIYLAVFIKLMKIKKDCRLKKIQKEVFSDVTEVTDGLD